MFTRPSKNRLDRTRGPVRHFDLIPSGGPTKARDGSDEAEDSDHKVGDPDHEAEASDHEAEHLSDDQSPDDYDDDKETLERDETGFRTEEIHIPFLDPNANTEGDSFHSGPDFDQKDIEDAREEYSSLLKKLTISRDQTEASSFETDRLLAIAVNLGVFTDNDTTEPLPPPPPGQGNHALQDYQMQLMLLEQQNKKRLLMARQEQDQIASGISDLPFAQNSLPTKVPEAVHSALMPETNYNPALRPKMQQSPLHSIQNIHLAHSTEASAQKQGRSGESQLVSRLLRRIDELEKATKRPEHQPVQGSSPLRFQVLHLLDDANSTVCLQEPTWTFGKNGRLQLRAELPLVDLDTHLRKNDDISFVVYKSYATPTFSATELAECLETGVLPAPEPSNEFIKIMSEELRVALEMFLTAACSIEEKQLGRFLDTLHAPYLFWYPHLQLLFDWIERNYAAKFDQFDEMKSRGCISHAFIEYLFFPGDVVVDQEGDKTKAYRLEDMPALQRVYHGRLHHSHEFEKMARASKDLQEQLMQRGRTFWSCRIKRPVSYKGGDEDASHTKLHLDKQKAKRIQDPIFSGASKDRTPLFVEDMDDDEPPRAPDIYLFPPTIPGFSLRRKVWIDLVVDRIVDISWNKEAFDHLVADDKTKELVHALVADRISTERNTDIIQGKGNGLIILLHGGPGTGKTFTAESVAELAEKPLYPVTCGDIGTEPDQVEQYLESVLYLGNLWDCVVLLDEADVFLEERGMADLARNALVSVFLRVLEYYDGILILTSNRVGTFDEAFKSRISLALHYPNLGKSQRCRIWKNFLNRLKALKEPGIDFDDIECNVLELAHEELNGRQIRNAITIGRQLAKFQKKDLSYAHLKHVVEVAGQFETYVKETKENFSDEQIARLHGRR
ncbi:hypothetical protein J4E91_010821 [Alternaria rosae]|nr:hypothetical protein J4E91_010821 [Alternaria rosae]